MWCTVIEKIKCKKCWITCNAADKKKYFYILGDAYVQQPCSECRKKYNKNRYNKGIWFYSDKKNNLKNKIKNDEK